MQRRVWRPWIHRWQEVAVPSSSQSWAGGRQSEWARDSQTPSGRSPGGTARYTWGRSSSGSPHAPRTCSDRSWAGRWPRRADSASCPCCKHRKGGAVTVKEPTVRRELMMSSHFKRTLIKSICLMHRGWPAPWLLPTERGVLQNKHFTHATIHTGSRPGRHLWGSPLPGIKAEGSLTVVHKRAAGLCC